MKAEQSQDKASKPTSLVSKNHFPLEDLQSLKQLRDELGLQAHLLKGELANEWKRLEKETKLLLHTQLDPIKNAAQESASEVSEASKLLLETVKEGYRKLKLSMQ